MFSFLFEGRLGEILAPNNEELDPNLIFQEALFAGRNEEVLELINNYYDSIQEDKRKLDINLPPIATAGNKPLHVASAKGMREVVVALLDRGVDLSGAGALGNTALHYAARGNHVEIVAELLRRGADPAAKNERGQAPAALAPATHAAELRRMLAGKLDPAAYLASLAAEAGGAPPPPPPGPELSTPPPPALARAGQAEEEEDDEDDEDADLTAGLAKLTLTPGPEVARRAAAAGALELDSEARDALVAAAAETARANAADMQQYQRRHDLYQLLQLAAHPKTRARNLKRLRAKVAKDPLLARARAAQHGALAQDGWAPAHAAAAGGNAEALAALLGVPGVSAWVRDLQGRTPLHLACEHGRYEVVELLKARMTEERAGQAPVGPAAPVDLSGRTPLGWSAKKAQGRRDARMEAALFGPGDASVLPGAGTPYAARSSRPAAATRSQRGGGRRGGEEGAAAAAPPAFGFAEAQGYRDAMEDALLHLAPLPGALRARLGGGGCGLFGVFDGHGGDFAAHFCAANLAPCLLAALEAAADPAEGRDPTDPDLLKAALRAAFLDLDARLAAEPLMAVEVKRGGGGGGGGGGGDGGGGRRRPAELEAEDKSGSTGCVALVTPRRVAVAAVGDSRAVLVRRAAEGGEGLEALALSEDFKPDNPAERERILAAGGAVVEVVDTEVPEGEAQRVYHRVKYDPAKKASLAMSRAFGDFLYKQQRRPAAAAAAAQEEEGVPKGEGPAAAAPEGGGDPEGEGEDKEEGAEGDGAAAAATRLPGPGEDGDLLPPEEQIVTAEPGLRVYERAPGRDLFLILACDGVWDELSNEAAAAALARGLAEAAAAGGAAAAAGAGERHAAACDAVLAEALARGTTDNLSIISVDLGATNPLSTTTALLTEEAGSAKKKLAF